MAISEIPTLPNRRSIQSKSKPRTATYGLMPKLLMFPHDIATAIDLIHWTSHCSPATCSTPHTNSRFSSIAEHFMGQTYNPKN
jgi:hypothetical protein